jgi:hypothetical protein
MKDVMAGVAGLRFALCNVDKWKRNAFGGRCIERALPAAGVPNIVQMSGEGSKKPGLSGEFEMQIATRTQRHATVTACPYSRWWSGELALEPNWMICVDDTFG